jgi:hypothetical protein
MKINKKILAAGLALMFLFSLGLTETNARVHSTTVRSHNRRTKSGKVVRVSRHRRYYQYFAVKPLVLTMGI